jgi:hypothetical protein
VKAALWRGGGLGLVLLACTACAPVRQVWFAPNIGSADMLDLFSRPEQWQRARGQVDVLQFYSQNLAFASPSECPRCGPNVASGLESVGAFPSLKAWHIAVAVEAPALKPYACTFGEALPFVERALDNAAAQGGFTQYLSLDEPLASSAACSYDTAAAAAQTAGFVHEMHRRHPGLVIGDVEPYPFFSAQAIEEWIDALAANQAMPQFFHLDVDHRRADLEGRDVTTDLAALKAFCAVRHIPFGVLLTGTDGADDAAYYQDVLAWTAKVGAAVGRPEHAVFQSFSMSSDGLFTVPRNLPEDDPSIFSHTRLLNDGIGLLGR